MDKFVGFISAFLVLFFLPTTTNAQIQYDGCIEFNNLNSGPITGQGSVKDWDYLYSNNSFYVALDSSFDLNGNLFFRGAEIVENGQFSLATGKYLYVNGGLRVNFYQKVCRIELKYSAAQISIGLNDKDIQSFPILDFVRAPQDLFPGVHMIVKPDLLQPYQGTLVLEGDIYNLFLGGRELSIDNICFNLCPPTPCEISDIRMKANLCDLDGNYYVDLDFNYTGTGDSFQILISGNTWIYAYNDLPISLGPFNDTFPIQLGSGGVMTQLGGILWDNNNRVCSRQFQISDTVYCNIPCALDSIEVQMTNCHNDGSFDISLDFNHQRSNVDSFGVYVGHKFLGLFSYSDLPLSLTNLPKYWGDKIPVTVFEYFPDGPIGPTFRCQSTQYLDNTCQTCFPNLVARVIDGPNLDGKYKLGIKFTGQATNIGTTLVYLNGILVDSFPQNQNYMTLNLSCNDFKDTVEVKLVDKLNGDCVTTTTYILKCNVQQPCALNDLHATISCTNTAVIFQINFVPQNPSHHGFDVWVSGTYYGFYAYSNLPLTLTVLPSSAAIYELKVCDGDNRDCCATLILDNPCASNNCQILAVKAEALPCDPNGNFYFIVRPQLLPNTFLDSFQVIVNGDLVGTFAGNNIPNGVRVGPFNGNPRRNFEIVVRDLSHPDCSRSISLIAGCAPLNCRIFDLVVEPYDCDNTGHFKVDLNFGHQNTSDLFDLMVNGQFFGTFNYNQLPLTLSNFVGNGQAMVFTVKDHEFNDCGISFTILAPNCTQSCHISNVKTEISDCINGQFYITLNFDHSSTSDSFQLFVATSNNTTILHGRYAYHDLPVRLGPFPGNGQGLVFLIKDTRHPDCAEDFRITAPNCQRNCDIFDVNAQISDCHNGQFYITLKFGHQFTSDSFNLIGPSLGAVMGRFAYSDLPISLGPFQGSGQGMVFIIRDLLNPDCAADFRITAPNCQQNCDIFDVNAHVSDCQNGQFYITLKFGHQFTSDSFNLIGPSSGTITGRFAYADLPITLGPYPGSGQTMTFLIKDVLHPDCAADFRITAPDCRQDCDIFDVSTTVTDCQNGQFYFTLKFGHRFTSDSFNLLGLNATLPLGRFAYADLPITLGPFPGNGQSMPFLIKDVFHPDCAADFRITAPDCQPRCHISDLTVRVGDCDTTGHFNVTLDFNHQNTSDSFFVVGNGRNYGTFAYSDLPITLGPLAGDGTTRYEFGVVDKADQSCRNSISIDPVYCGDDCRIYNVRTEILPCNSRGDFNVALKFDHANTSGVGFLVFANGRLFGPYPANHPQPIILGPFAGNGNTYDLLILDQGNALCFAFANIGPVNCGDCKISNIETRVTDCNNLGEFYVWLDFDHAFTGNQGFSVRGNGQQYGSFGYDQLPVKLGPFRGDGRSVYELIITDNAHPDCGNHTQVGPVNCFNAPCRIFDINAIATPCTPNGIFYVDIKFNFQSIGNQGFSIKGNGRNYGRFLYNQLPVRIGPLVGDGRTVYEFIVYDNENPDCRNATTLGPINCNQNACQINDLSVRVGNCNNDGTYKIQLNFNVRNTTNGLFDVFTPVGLLGTYRISDLPLTINNFPASRNAFDKLEVCINDNARCCASIQFAAPRCQHDCVQFDSQPVGKVFKSNAISINDSLFTESSVVVRSGGFIPSTSGVRFDSISIDTANQFFDAAEGHQITTWNATLLFNFPRIVVTPCTEISFDYFQIGAENNISINGMPVMIFERFTDLPANLHGVRIEVFPLSPREGRMVIRGFVESLRIGGNQLSLDNLCFKPCQSTSPVWPGDANLDFVTSHYDLLNIGLAFNKEEIQRAEISTNWTGFPAEDWISNFGNRANLKNADCDGNGTVDFDDVKAIVKNYGKMHGEILNVPKIPVAANAAPLFIKFPEASSIEAGKAFKAVIHLGTEDLPIENAYGLAFTLRYDPTKFRIQNIQYPPSWFGEPGENVLTIDKIYESAGIAHVALTRNDFENVSGKGAIVEIIGIIDNIAGRVGEVEINITDVVAISKNELLLPLNTPKNLLDLSTDTKDLVFENQISIFPNPTSDKIYIKVPDNEPIDRVEIFRTDGVLMENQLANDGIVHVEKLSPGLYILKIKIGERTIIRKIMKNDL